MTVRECERIAGGAIAPLAACLQGEIETGMNRLAPTSPARCCTCAAILTPTF